MSTGGFGISGRTARKRLGRHIPYGVADSGLAAAATFLVGIYAVREFPVVELGIYSLFFSAFQLATVVPRSLIFLPAQVRMLQLPPRQRLRSVLQSLRVGILPAILSAALVGLAMPAAYAGGATRFTTLMAVSAFVVAVVSPMQDHVRTVLHYGELSWGAAAVSATQFAATAVALGVATAVGVDAVWVPFGSLTAANLASIVAGLLIVNRTGIAAPSSFFDVRNLVAPGRWLLAGKLLPRGAELIQRTLVVALAGANVLGAAEGARIAARPLAVFIVGVSVVVGPRAMTAARDLNRPWAKKLDRAFDLGVLSIGLLYLGVAGVEWSVNPMARIIPSAFAETGLVAFTIVATTASNMLFSQRSQLIGGGQERVLTGLEALASVALVVAAFSAPSIGAFAVPLGLLTMSITRWIGYRLTLKRYYANASAPGKH